jgi:hypothetical protein
MATVWDFADGFDALVVDTQRTRVRPKTQAASFTVVAIAAGALFCLSDPGTLSLERGLTSIPVIGIQKVLRTEANPPGRPVRRERRQYAPDARDGLSTHRLAQTFTSVFTPVGEDSAGVDFSFG